MYIKIDFLERSRHLNNISFVEKKHVQIKEKEEKNGAEGDKI